MVIKINQIYFSFNILASSLFPSGILISCLATTSAPPFLVAFQALRIDHRAKRQPLLNFDVFSLQNGQQEPNTGWWSFLWLRFGERRKTNIYLKRTSINWNKDSGKFAANDWCVLAVFFKLLSNQAQANLYLVGGVRWIQVFIEPRVSWSSLTYRQNVYICKLWSNV